MREPNFSSPTQNRAAVVITATLYDRRALDCTATLPLVNSLTHLAYMTSTSPRIREILAADGGLERLVKILATCQHTDKHSLWKWSLAFQCVVNVGVRGTETIRSRVVEAGAVHVVLAILENFMNALDQAKIEKDLERKQQQQLQQQQQQQQQTNYHYSQQTALSLPTMPTTALNNTTSTPILSTAATANASSNNGANTTTTTSTVNKPIGEQDEQVEQDQEEELDENNNQDGQNNNNNRLHQVQQQHANHHSNVNNNNNTDSHQHNHHNHTHSPNHNVYCRTPSTMVNMHKPTTTLFNSNNLFVIPKRSTFITRSLKLKSKPYTASLSSIPLLNNLSTDAVLHREEDILLSLQLLAYLSKYPQIRQAFHANHRHNVFSVVEKFTHRLHPAAIIYWAGVIMRNACRKDEARGGVRQCANMQCGKWERFPREFAKCRRCRKAKYCSKSCQSKAWADGHRWWCVERPNHGSHPPNPTATSSTTVAAAAAVVAAAEPPPPPTEQVVHLEDNVVTSDVLTIPISPNEPRRTPAPMDNPIGGGGGGRNQGDERANTGGGQQQYNHGRQNQHHTRRSSLPVTASTTNNNQDTIMTPANRMAHQQGTATGTQGGNDLLLYHQLQQREQRRNSRSIRSLQAAQAAVQSGSSTEVEADSDHRRRDLMDVD